MRPPQVEVFFLDAEEGKALVNFFNIILPLGEYYFSIVLCPSHYSKYDMHCGLKDGSLLTLTWPPCFFSAFIP